MGMLPGVADLVVIVDGRAKFLELKAKGQFPSAVQIAFAEAAKAAGCDYRWADCIDDALYVLELWGALPAQRVAA